MYGFKARTSLKSINTEMKRRPDYSDEIPLAMMENLGLVNEMLLLPKVKKRRLYMANVDVTWMQTTIFRNIPAKETKRCPTY
jgi:hypothetical protein